MALLAYVVVLLMAVLLVAKAWREREREREREIISKSTCIRGHNKTSILHSQNLVYNLEFEF